MDLAGSLADGRTAVDFGRPWSIKTAINSWLWWQVWTCATQATPRLWFESEKVQPCAPSSGTAITNNSPSDEYGRLIVTFLNSRTRWKLRPRFQSRPIGIINRCVHTNRNDQRDILLIPPSSGRSAGSKRRCHLTADVDFRQVGGGASSSTNPGKYSIKSGRCFNHFTDNGKNDVHWFV